MGSPATHRAITGQLARRCQARVFAADYRLAPEHPFPAAALALRDPGLPRPCAMVLFSPWGDLAGERPAEPPAGEVMLDEVAAFLSA